MEPNPQNSRSVLDNFTGSLDQRNGVSFMYRAAMSAVAAVMVLLPLIYVAIIVAVGWGITLYARYGLVILSGLRNIWGLVLYFGPLVAGVVMIVVMIGPLFSTRKRGPEPLFVTQEQEPELYALVTRVCREVRAPLPRKIAIMCDVNAFASFEPGLLAFLLGRLRLTVGMPLVRGLTTEQLTGVLAHEFGHFAQGGGMRFSYIIRAINAWFARVVYERSGVERSVAGLGNSGFAALALVALLSSGLMSGARWILRGLMKFAHLISAYLLRQMEFDADAHMARIVGSETLIAAMSRLPQLDAGARRAWQIVDEFGRTNKLPADVNVLIADASQRLPGSVRARLAQELENDAQGRFDTHPSHKARIDAARRLAAPGIFHDSEPATHLFTDIDALSREATRHHYAILAGVDMSKITLVEHSDATQRDKSRVYEQEAADALFEGLPFTHLKLRLDDESTAIARSNNEPEIVTQALHTARTDLAAAITAARPLIVRWDKTQDAWRSQLLANSLFDAGFVSQARQIKGASNLKKVIDTINELEHRAAELNQATAALQHLEPAVSAFINAAEAQRLRNAAKIQDPALQSKERTAIFERVKILSTLCAVAEDHRKMEETAYAMPTLIQLLSAKGEVSQDDINMAMNTVNLGVSAGNRCANAFSTITCPFDEMPEGSKLNDYLLGSGNPSAHAIVHNTQLVSHLYTRMDEAGQRIAGWFAATFAE